MAVVRFEVWTRPESGTFVRRFPLKGTNQFALSLGIFGRGSITFPKDFPRLDDIIYIDPSDHSNDKASIIRAYIGDTHLYDFYATRADINFGDTGQRLVKITGGGPGTALDRTFVYPYDYDANPSIQPDWEFGGNNQLLENPSFEDTFINGTFEDGTVDPWIAIAGSDTNPLDVDLKTTTAEAQAGTYSLEIDPGKRHSGAEIDIAASPSNEMTIDGFVKSATVGRRITCAVKVETGMTFASTEGYIYNGWHIVEIGNVARNAAHNGLPGGSTDGTWQALGTIKVTPGSETTSVTYRVQDDHHDNTNGPVFYIDSFTATGIGVGLDPWESLNLTVFEADSTIGVGAGKYDENTPAAWVASAVGGGTPSEAFHGYRWVTASEYAVGDYISVDTLSVKRVSRLVLISGDANFNNQSAINVESSQDGIVWDLETTLSATSAGTWPVDLPSIVSARYWRFYSTGSSGTKKWSIDEFDIWLLEGSSAKCTGPDASAIFQDFDGMESGILYSGSAWVYHEEGVNKNIKLEYSIADNAAATISTVVSVPDSTWTQITMSWTATQETGTFSIINDSGGIITWWVDDTSASEGLPKATYGEIMGIFLDDAATDHAPQRTSLDFLIKTFTDALDSDTVAWDQNVSFSVKRGQAYRRIVTFHGDNFGYEADIHPNAADDTIIEFDLFNIEAMGQDFTTGDTGAVTKSGLVSVGPFIRREPLASYAMVEGDGQNWGESYGTVLRDAWGPIETYEGSDEVLTGTLSELADRLTGGTEAETIVAKFQNPNLVPGVDYKLGDIVWLALGEDILPAAAYRVISIDIASGDPEPTFQVQFVSKGL